MRDFEEIERERKQSAQNIYALLGEKFCPADVFTTVIGQDRVVNGIRHVMDYTENRKKELKRETITADRVFAVYPIRTNDDNGLKPLYDPTRNEGIWTNNLMVGFWYGGQVYIGTTCPMKGINVKCRPWAVTSRNGETRMIF